MSLIGQPGNISGVTNPLQLAVHPGAFPSTELARVRDAFTRRTVPPGLHYQGACQAARWRALYDAWSPFSRVPDYVKMFERCFEAACDRISSEVTIVGLGCGTAAKDVKLIDHLVKAAKQIHFVPVDVSVPLVCEAALAAGERLGAKCVYPMVANLEAADDLGEWLSTQSPGTSGRLFTFFSMLPNFPPGAILPTIAGWLRSQDFLLLSVNLAPGPELMSGMANVLPQYDNPETHSWLFTFLEQGGVRPEDGVLRFAAEPFGDSAEVGRIVARWRFHRACRLHVLADVYEFEPDEELELFYSWRYRSQTFPATLEEQGFKIEESWLAANGEEAIYLCRTLGGR